MREDGPQRGNERPPCERSAICQASLGPTGLTGHTAPPPLGQGLTAPHHTDLNHRCKSSPAEQVPMEKAGKERPKGLVKMELQEAVWCRVKDTGL